MKHHLQQLDYMARQLGFDGAQAALAEARAEALEQAARIPGAKKSHPMGNDGCRCSYCILESEIRALKAPTPPEPEGRTREAEAVIIDDAGPMLAYRDAEISRLKQEAEDREQFIDKRISDACAMVSMDLEKKILERDALLDRARELMAYGSGVWPERWLRNREQWLLDYDAMEPAPERRASEAVPEKPKSVTMRLKYVEDKETGDVRLVNEAAPPPTPPPPAPAAGLLAQWRGGMRYHSVCGTDCGCSRCEALRTLDDFEARARSNLDAEPDRATKWEARIVFRQLLEELVGIRSQQ